MTISASSLGNASNEGNEDKEIFIFFFFFFPLGCGETQQICILSFPVSKLNF